MTTFIASVAVAFGVSFICSLIEAALLSLTPGNVAELSRINPKAGAIWRCFKSDIGRPIAVILLLNTSTHTIGATVAGAKFDEIFGEENLWWFSLAFTFLMLQYTEILPKTLGVRFNMILARRIATPLFFAVRLLSPIVSLIHLINRPFEPKEGVQDEGGQKTLDEITSLASAARMAKQIGWYQEKIILSATRLSITPVRNVMIPASQVAFLIASQTIQDAFLIAHADAHTRFPVLDADGSGKVVGYVNFKEMIYFMHTNPREPGFAGIIRPVIFIDPEAKASELLKTFVEQHNHIAVVADKEGACLGIATLEDVVEELVGEIEDEFDRLPQYVHPLKGGLCLFGGGVPFVKIGETLGVGGGSENESGNVAEWLARRLPGKLKPGDAVEFNGITITVRRVKRGKAFDATACRTIPAGE